ncbi:MAG TPA: hypothetical protein VFS39_15360, partial [Nitrospira sp.]|nr:hypothetical protein [Nitrospira sp.]
VLRRRLNVIGSANEAVELLARHSETLSQLEAGALKSPRAWHVIDEVVEGAVRLGASINGTIPAPIVGVGQGEA